MKAVKFPTYPFTFTSGPICASLRACLGHSRPRGSTPTLVLARCYSNNGQRRVRSDCPLSANSGHEPVAKKKDRLTAVFPNSDLSAIAAKADKILWRSISPLIRI